MFIKTPKDDFSTEFNQNSKTPRDVAPLKGRPAHTRGRVTWTQAGHKRHVAAIVFLVRHPRFCQKFLLRGQNSVPTTRCMKFSWFEFVRHKAGTK